MNKVNKNIIIYSSKKSSRDIIYTNLSPKMSNPAFQINYTLKKYVDKKLNENIDILDKELFKKKHKKLKSFHGIAKRNNRQIKYFTNSLSKDNLQIFTSLQNLSISILNSNNKNNNNEDSKLIKNMTYKKRDNPNKIFSYTKINNKKLRTNKNDYINKSSNKIKFTMSGKIPRIKSKKILKKYNHSSSMTNIKIKNSENNKPKTNLKEKSYVKTLFRFNSSDFTDINLEHTNINKNNNLYTDRRTTKNLDENNNMTLSQRINTSHISKKINVINKKNNQKGKNLTKNKRRKNNINNKSKNNIIDNNKILSTNVNINKKTKKKIISNDIKKNTCFNELKNYNTEKYINKLNNNINNANNNNTNNNNYINNKNFNNNKDLNNKINNINNNSKNSDNNNNTFINNNNNNINKKNINNKDNINDNYKDNMNNKKDNINNNNKDNINNNIINNNIKINDNNNDIKVNDNIKTNDNNNINNINNINNYEKNGNNSNNKINKNNNNNNDIKNYYVPNLEKIEKTESNNSSSIFNIHLNDKKIIDGYELYWNLKNDYSKDIDISFISISNQKKSIVKNYKLNPSNYSNNFNDNNNINNIYLNNIQNVNNINNKQDDINIINNRPEYYSKLELLENENKLLKNEIKESKNRISILEYKIEELLDDKNCKENTVCPQPTPYVIKYSKDIIPIKVKPKIEENNQEPISKKSNDNIKEYSKNETNESEMSNRIVNKNEE